MPKEVLTSEDEDDFLKLIEELEDFTRKKQPDIIINVYEKNGETVLGKPFEDSFVADRARDIHRELGYKGLYRLNVYHK